MCSGLRFSRHIDWGSVYSCESGRFKRIFAASLLVTSAACARGTEDADAPGTFGACNESHSVQESIHD